MVRARRCSRIRAMRPDMRFGFRDMSMPSARPPLLEPATEAHRESAASPSHHRKIKGQDDEPEGNHPKAEDRKKAEHPTCDESSANSDARQLRLRQREGLVAIAEFGHAD